MGPDACPDDFKKYISDSTYWERLINWLEYVEDYPYAEDYAIPTKPLINSPGLTKSASEIIESLGICG